MDKMWRPPYTEKVARGLGHVIAFLDAAQQVGDASELYDQQSASVASEIDSAIMYLKNLRAARKLSSGD